MKLAAGPSVRTSTVAKWIKRPALSLPYSLKIDNDGVPCSTVGLAEMHDATVAFYDKLYNNGDRLVLPDPAHIGADIIPADFHFDNFHEVVKKSHG